MKSLKYTVSDADFGITKGSELVAFSRLAGINKLDDEPGDGDNLRYNC